ncbi:MAG: GNAT family N-acetyltransferase [Nakamurella sp.]
MNRSAPSASIHLESAVLATTALIEELTIPPSIDSPNAGDFIEMVAVRNKIEATTVGTDALGCTPEELLPVYRSQEFEPKRIFVARVAGRIVGRAILSWSIADGTTSSWVSAEVLPEHRDRGIGSALFHHVEELALGSGRPVLQSEVMHTGTEGGERIASPTGIGDLPADDPGVRFLLRRGYRLEQTERLSFLDLPLDPGKLERRLQAAQRAAGPEYALVDWSGPTPPERREDMMTLLTRMSTDAPFAGLEMDEEPWTPERLANNDRAVTEGGGVRLTMTVEHLPTGRIVGFNELVLPKDRSRPVQQQDTLVLAEHRGHRLGMVMKLANLRELATVEPRAQLVVTFNAEENRHMLSVNEAIGFRAAGKAGCWRKAD